jgi:hypothetical protein
MFTPVKHVPWLGKAIEGIGKGAATGMGKLLKGSIAKPMAEGAAAGAMVEGARPLATTDETDAERIMTGILMGGAMNAGLHNIAGGAKYGIAAGKNKWKNYKNASETKNAVLESAAKSQGLSEAGILERIIREAGDLEKRAKEKGISIEELANADAPNYAPQHRKDGFDFWDSKKAESDYNAASKFENMPLSLKAREIAARAGINDNALKATLSPESLKKMANLHSEGRLGVGRRHLNELYNEQWKKDGAPDAKDLYMEQHGGDLVDPTAVKELGDWMKSFELNHATGGTLSKHHKPAKDILDEYAEKLLNPDGTPKEITLAEWSKIRNELGGRKSDFEGKINLENISGEGKAFLDKVYKAFKKQEFEMLDPEARKAHELRAEFKDSFDDIIENIAKNNAEAAAPKYADIIANVSNDAIAKKQAVLEWLRKSDEVRGKNFEDEARHLSYSQNLTGNAGNDVPFHFPNRNMYNTGKSLSPDKLTVQEAVDLLRFYAGKDLDRTLNTLGDLPRLPMPGKAIEDALLALPPPAPKSPPPAPKGGATFDIPEAQVKSGAAPDMPDVFPEVQVKAAEKPGGLLPEVVAEETKYANPKRERKPTEEEIIAAVDDAKNAGIKDDEGIINYVYSRFGSDYVPLEMVLSSSQRKEER